MIYNAIRSSKAESELEVTNLDDPSGSKNYYTSFDNDTSSFIWNSSSLLITQNSDTPFIVHIMQV